MSSNMLGAAIRTAREASGMSIRELAKSAKINHSTLSRWEAGRSHPTRIALDELIQALPLEMRDADHIRSLYRKGDNTDLLPPEVAALGWNGNVLRAFRIQNHLSQSQLANIFQVSQGTLSKWESDRAIPTNDQLKRIEALLDGTPLGPHLREVAHFVACIETMDTSDCFRSYEEYWKSCRHFDLGIGEVWGIALTNRLRFLSKKDPEALRLLSWTYASRIDWLLVRDREDDVFALAFEGIQSCRGLHFDFTGSNIFSLPTRSILTKRKNSVQDIQMMETMARLTNKYCAYPELSIGRLISARLNFIRGNFRCAEKLLSEAKHHRGNYEDCGQMGILGQEKWIENRTLEEYQFAFRANDLECIESLDTRGHHWSPVTNMMISSYRVAAQAKLQRPGFERELIDLRKQAKQDNMHFALDTIIRHIHRMTGIDLTQPD